MGFNGGGISVTTAHVHSNATGQGGSLSNDSLIINASLIGLVMGA